MRPARPKQVVQLYPQGDHIMSSMPIENAAKAAASGPQTIVGADGHVSLPTTEQLLQQATAQQSVLEHPVLPPQTDAPAPSYTPTNLDPRVLAKAMSAYVKAQTQFIHDKDLTKYVEAMETHADVLAQFVHSKHLPTYAGAMEANITELTAALEQQGVL